MQHKKNANANDAKNCKNLRFSILPKCRLSTCMFRPPVCGYTWPGVPPTTFCPGSLHQPATAPDPAAIAEGRRYNSEGFPFPQPLKTKKNIKRSSWDKCHSNKQQANLGHVPVKNRVAAPHWVTLVTNPKTCPKIVYRPEILWLDLGRLLLGGQLIGRFHTSQETPKINEI